MEDTNKTKEVLRAIKEVRIKKVVSQRELARRLGMASGNYSRIENGKHRLSAEMIFSIAEALEVEPAELLGKYSEDFLELWNAFQELSLERRERILESVRDLGKLEKLSQL